MATLLLLLIYLAFISLGLPDTLLGAAWPTMRADLAAPLDAAGLVSFIITAGTIVSSLSAEKLVRKFGTGLVTAVSVSATAVALFAAGFSRSFVWLLVIAVPLGLGAGAVDSVLNNYVALHYEPRHMSWLHSFWGVGAFLGPLILGTLMNTGNTWRSGYIGIGITQIVISLLLFLSLPMWRKREKPLPPAGASAKAEEGTPPAADTPLPPVSDTLRLPGVVPALITFFFYCAAELSVGLWGSSFLVETRGYTPAAAATGVSFFYGGITIGRFLSGFLTMRFSGTRLIRMGIFTILAGGLLLLLPLPGFAGWLPLLIIGLGCAPIYPSMIHETPNRFGAQNSQRIISWQMASAYTGSTLMPPLLGVVANLAGVWVFPVFLLFFAVGMLLFSERVTRAVKAAHQAEKPDSAHPG